MIFAPTVNIARTPRAGRTFEGYGEDPWLTSRLGVAWIKGAQSTSVIGNVKHFAANNQEGVELTNGKLSEYSPLGLGLIGTRYAQNSVVEERVLREIYLPQFEAAVKEAKVGTIMCSYNRLNGRYACQNPTLLKGILRKDWGFEGYTIADYLAIHSTGGGLNDGLDFEPWPPIGYQPLLINTAMALGPVNKVDQDALIEVVAAAQSKTVVVLQSGGADLTPWRSKIAGLISAWYPGAHGGPAIARVLFGDVDPGGRLPITFPASESQLPTAVSKNRYPGGGLLGLDTRYDEGVFVGYRWYDEKKLAPAYPFGYGLSYTTFALSKLAVTRSGAGAVVSAVVKNTGKRTGFAVPQLYVGLPDQSATVQQPPSALKGFTKVKLAPGQSRTVTMHLDQRALSYWNASAKTWSVTLGCAAVKVGFSSRDLPLNGKLPIGGGRC